MANPINLTQSFSLSNRAVVTSLFLIWLAVQSFLFIKFGGRTSVDSELYLADAANLLEGRMPQGRSIWYVSYAAFLSAIFFFGGDITTVVFIQILLSGVAAFCLYHLTIEIFNKKNVAVLAVLFYLLWIKIHEWNTFLYTESLFTSCSIISFTVLVKAKSHWQYAMTFLLILFTFFIRPTGFAFLIGLGCYGFFSLNHRNLKKIIPIFSCLVIIGLVLLSKMLASYTLIDSYAKAEIIYPNMTLGIEVPAELVIPSQDRSTMMRVILFGINNPLYFLKLFSLKLFLFLGNIKPYFSLLHNVWIVGVLYPLYFFAVRGFSIFPEHRKEKYFIVGFVIAQSLTVAFTSENWDGRFLVPLLPFVFLLSANGIVTVFKKMK
jgi:Dolichyl-phosphate-mannose-protein mannosyltransferase